MTRGFVTIATGKIKYHKMAYILLQSYRRTSENPMPFAIITDERNEYTKHFDDVIVLQDATRSYMDKIKLLKISPYDETIFIDADCIAFNDLNVYWSVFEKASDFSCFGYEYNLFSDKGWFDYDNLRDYKQKVNKTVDFHGGIYFIRKGEVCDLLYEECMKISREYEKFQFKKFRKPADEPILALGMTVHNCSVCAPEPSYFAWYRRTKNISADFFEKKLSYIFEGRAAKNGCLMHFGTARTIMPLYLIESKKVRFYEKNNRRWNVCEECFYKITSYVISFLLCIGFSWKKIQKKWKI